MRTLKTHLVLGTACGGSEHELPLEIKYSVTKGSDDFWDGQMWQQGWGAEANIDSARIRVGSDWIAAPQWLFGLFYGDESLHAELLADDAEADEYARDQKADADREERRLA